MSTAFTNVEDIGDNSVNPSDPSKPAPCKINSVGIAGNVCKFNSVAVTGSSGLTRDLKTGQIGFLTSSSYSTANLLARCRVSTASSVSNDMVNDTGCLCGSDMFAGAWGHRTSFANAFGVRPLQPGLLITCR